MSAPIRVERDPIEKNRWLVECGLCKPFGMFGLLVTAPIFTSTIAHATAPATWADAVFFAHRHAAKHAEATCPTCGHTPTGAIPLDDHAAQPARGETQ